eukprot:13965816-Alexandrium_andersonii.AAC.1
MSASATSASADPRSRSSSPFPKPTPEVGEQLALTRVSAVASRAARSARRQHCAPRAPCWISARLSSS